MAKENKNLNKKPKLNPYWIYGIIIAIFFGIQIIRLLKYIAVFSSIFYKNDYN